MYNSNNSRELKGVVKCVILAVIYSIKAKYGEGVKEAAIKVVNKEGVFKKGKLKVYYKELY